MTLLIASTPMQAKKIELIKAIKEIELIEVIQLVKVRNWGNLACFNCTSQNVKEQNDTTIEAGVSFTAEVEFEFTT